MCDGRSRAPPSPPDSLIPGLRSKCCSQVQQETAPPTSFFGNISAQAQPGSANSALSSPASHCLTGRGFIVVNLLVLVASASGDAAAARRGAAFGCVRYVENLSCGD